MLEKIAPWGGRYILVIDTLGDQTNVPQAIEQLNLKAIVIKSVAEVWAAPHAEDKLPSFDTVIVDTLAVAEKLREVEHLRYIPIVLLAPVSLLFRRYHRMLSDDCS